METALCQTHDLAGDHQKRHVGRALGFHLKQVPLECLLRRVHPLASSPKALAWGSLAQAVKHARHAADCGDRFRFGDAKRDIDRIDWETRGKDETSGVLGDIHQLKSLLGTRNPAQREAATALTADIEEQTSIAAREAASQDAADWAEFTRKACTFRGGKIAHRLIRDENCPFTPEANGHPLDLNDAASAVKALFDPY